MSDIRDKIDAFKLRDMVRHLMEGNENAAMPASPATRRYTPHVEFILPVGKDRTASIIMEEETLSYLLTGEFLGE